MARPKYVLGPSGYLTLENLPPPGTTRWTPRRKADIIAAVEGKLISRKEALERYNWSDAEFVSMSASYHRHGLEGLKVTKIQKFRDL